MQENALKASAKANPDIKFVFIDGNNMGLKNVTSVLFKEEQAGFLAGYAAIAESIGLAKARKKYTERVMARHKEKTEQA